MTTPFAPSDTPSPQPTWPVGLPEYIQSLPFLGTLTCSHSQITAGEYAELSFDYTVGASGIADGATLKIAFRFYSDWALFQTHDPAAADYISAEFLERESFPGESRPTVRRLQVKFDQKGHERPFQKAILIHLVDGYIRPGDRILIRVGDRRHGGPGTRVQSFAEERFQFRGFVDTAGTSRLAAVPGDVVLNITPGAPVRLVLTTPRVVRTATAYPIHLRLEDRWGNTCRNLGREVPVILNSQIESADKPSASPTSLPARFPANGWATTRILESGVSEAGDHILTADVSETFPSVPTARAAISKSTDFPAPRAYFADLHVHSNHTVGTNDNPWNFHYGRDVAGLDVFGYTANDFQITEGRWQEAVDTCRALTRDGEFVAFPGTEWNGNSALGGDRNVIFLGDRVDFPFDEQGRNLRSCEWNEDSPAGAQQVPGASPVSAIWKAYEDRPDEHLMIPHIGGRRVLLEWHHPGLERLVEVASAWGHFPELYEEALARGYCVGVSAAGDEHRGRPGGGAPGVGVFGVHGGLTGILAPELTRPAIAQALRQRRTWACYGGGTRSVAILKATAGRKQSDADSDAVYQGGFLTKPTDGRIRFQYSLHGDPADGGWERVELRDRNGIVESRDLLAENGLSNRIRVTWAGARIPDRYRWAEWRGTLLVRGATVLSHHPVGLEHPEEWIRETGVSEDGTAFEIRTDTYGDTDGLDLELDSLENLELDLRLDIGAYNKTATGGIFTSDALVPKVEWRITGAQVLGSDGGQLVKHLGGHGLRLGVQRWTDGDLATQLEGTVEVTVPSGEGNDGARSAGDHSGMDGSVDGRNSGSSQPPPAYYIYARQASGAVAITSPVFVAG
jgi:hypothetical protein